MSSGSTADATKLGTLTTELSRRPTATPALAEACGPLNPPTTTRGSAMADSPVLPRAAGASAVVAPPPWAAMEPCVAGHQEWSAGQTLSQTVLLRAMHQGGVDSSE